MKKLKKYFNDIKWTRYWIAHMIIALAISVVFMAVGGKSLPYIGAVFYLSRELAQYEEKETNDPKTKFDWMGFVMPLLACILLAWL